ncbi:Fumarate hydratase class I, partial [Durusdinium trenchii]
MNVPFLPLLLSKSARRRLMDEMQQHVLRQCTKDPAMPTALQNLITSLVQIFWADMVVELELDASSNRCREDDEEESASGGSVGPQGPLGRALSPWLVPSALSRDSRAEELAAAPDIATGMLQVLVVEARDLRPVHGIGTNPYVRGRLGEHVRRSPTVWSNLRPAWNCLMEFPVVSTRGNLELEVMSRAPLFGSDTRLGYVSVPLDDIISPAGPSAVLTTGPGNSQLAYRCEPLLGAKGELVLIIDYRKLQAVRRRLSCGAFGNALARRAAQFRAFFLYHYWPCDKSIFQMYMHEPIDICLLLLSLSPFLFVRVLFYTVLLLCLCFPWPPDEHQIVQFILAFKGTASISDGAGQVVYGILIYYLCARRGTCSAGGAPGTGVSSAYVIVDLYQEVLVWAVCFLLLPRSLPYLNRSSATGLERETQSEDTHRGGRMNALLQYNLLVFAFSLSIFLVLSVRDTVALSWDDGQEAMWHLWHWRVAENFFWARTIFGLGMFPFFFLLHPQINKLLTHSTPTGYTRLGTLKRHKPILRPKPPGTVRPHEALEAKDSPTEPLPPLQELHELSPVSDGIKDPEPSDYRPLKAIDSDPVEDLRAVIRRLPGGRAALFAGSMWLRATGKAVNAAVTVVSLEIRVASAGVSLGLRAADAGRSAALQVARRVVPGSDTAVVRFMLARAEAARSTTVILVGHCDRLLQGPVSLTTRLVRQVPLGPTALSVLGTMGRLGKGLVRTCFLMAAAVESPEVIGSTSGDGMPLVQAGLPTMELLQAAGGSELAELSGKAELVKLEAAARLAELLTRAERLAEREVAEAREALQRVQPEISKISQALRDRSQGWAWELKRAKSACESMCRSTVAFTCDLAWRLPLAGQVLLDAFQRELEDLQEQKPARRSWLQTFEAYSRVMFSSACEAVLELRPKHMPSMRVPAQTMFAEGRPPRLNSRGNSPAPPAKASSGQGRSSSLPRPPKASPDDKGADGTEPDHGNSAPLLPEVR